MATASMPPPHPQRCRAALMRFSLPRLICAVRRRFRFAPAAAVRRRRWLPPLIVESLMPHRRHFSFRADRDCRYAARRRHFASPAPMPLTVFAAATAVYEPPLRRRTTPIRATSRRRHYAEPTRRPRRCSRNCQLAKCAAAMRCFITPSHCQMNTPAADYAGEGHVGCRRRMPAKSPPPFAVRWRLS